MTHLITAGDGTQMTVADDAFDPDPGSSIRRDRFTVRSARRVEIGGRFSACLDLNGGGFWAVQNTSNSKGGPPVATLAGSVWSKEHSRQLAALADGVPYVPGVPAFGKPSQSPEDIAKAMLEVLVQSRDATVESTDMVRYLVGNEAAAGGTFREACLRHENETWPTFARELFASLYDEPKPTDSRPQGPEWIVTLLQAAKNSASWPDLQRLAKGEPWSAGVGAAEIVQALGETINDLLEELPKEDPQRLQDQADQLAEMVGEDHEATTEEQAKADAVQAAQLKVAEALQTLDLASVPAAVTAAVQALAGIDGQLQALGAGSNNPNPLLASTPHEVREALAKNPVLRGIADVAGRLRVAARAVKRNKVRYLPEQIVDVSLGAELSRLLPAELLQLAEPDVEDNLLRKLSESQAMVYDLEGSEPVKMGPIVVAIDSSSSMAGQRYEWAMGVALALVERAVSDKRPFRLFTFAMRPNTVYTVDKPRDITVHLLQEMLTTFSGGGTDIGRAVRQAAELTRDKTWTKADLVLISDGEDGDFSPSLYELSEQGVCAYGISIGSTFSEPVKSAMSGVAAVSDLQIQDGSANVDVVFGLDGVPRTLPTPAVVSKVDSLAAETAAARKRAMDTPF